MVSAAVDEEQLLEDLAKEELKTLAATPMARVETTLLIHPRVLEDYHDFNEFMGRANDLIADLRLRGIIQLADFHPEYQFAGIDADAPENYTNRSPYPMLAPAARREPSPRSPIRTIRSIFRGETSKTLRGLGRERIREMLKQASV